MTDYEPSQAVLNKGRNLAVDRVTLEVLVALEERGLDAILLKGPAHAQWLYDPPHLRTYSDTDLLVGPDAVAETEEILTRLGFELPEIYSEGDRPTHEHAWVRHRDGARVDVHWNLDGSSVDAATAWSVLSWEPDTIDLGGRDVKVLPVEGRALHVALHAAQHGSELGTAVDDLARAVSIDPAIWVRARELADQTGALVSMSAGLRLDPRGAEIADRLGLPTEIPRELSLQIANQKHALALRWVLSQKGLAPKMRFIVDNLFPRPSFMRQWSSLARKGALGLALAYLWRPVHLAVHLVIALRGLRKGGQKPPD